MLRYTRCEHQCTVCSIRRSTLAKLPKEGGRSAQSENNGPDICERSSRDRSASEAVSSPGARAAGATAAMAAAGRGTGASISIPLASASASHELQYRLPASCDVSNASLWRLAHDDHCERARDAPATSALPALRGTPSSLRVLPRALLPRVSPSGCSVPVLLRQVAL